MEHVPTLDEFLSQPLVAHVATQGPTVRPVWFLWEDDAFWWLTGPWSSLGRLLDEEPRIALVVDACDLRTGEVFQVTAHGTAEVIPLDRARAGRKLAKYLGDDVTTWPRRFREPLADPETRLVRLTSDKPLALRDMSYGR